MRKVNVILLCSIAVLFTMLAISPASACSSYAEDRAQIEDLQGRYLFALDFDDVETFVSLFTPNGTFMVNSGGTLIALNGRDAIRQSTLDRLADKLARDAADPVYQQYGWRARGHHYVSNIVLKIKGNKAVGRSYWSNSNNSNPERKSTWGTYGHYEDEFVKVRGKWLFSLRKVIYENRNGLFAPDGNPAW